MLPLIAGDLFVFVDECHRTQTGTFNKLMKAMLPDATFIGFTGTPLLKKDRSISKLGWIRRERQKFQDQPRQARPLLIDRESHWVWGNRLLLEVVEADRNPWVTLSPHTLRLRVRPGSDRAKRAEVLAAWYRAQVYEAVGKLLPEWQARLGVEVAKVHVRHMKTKWGSCNPAKRTIRLNTQLGKAPRRCLEYVVVHEMAHFIEPNHGRRFMGLLDTHLPGWRTIRDELNRSRLDAEDWGEG